MVRDVDLFDQVVRSALKMGHCGNTMENIFKGCEMGTGQKLGGLVTIKMIDDKSQRSYRGKIKT